MNIYLSESAAAMLPSSAKFCQFSHDRLSFAGNALRVPRAVHDATKVRFFVLTGANKLVFRKLLRQH